MSAEPPPVDPESLEAQRARMRRLARSLVRDYDRAEDVVQETCLRALTGTVRPRRTLGGCLAGVVRNVARHVHRGDRRRVRREQDVARPEQVPSTVDLLARLEEQRRVLACVRGLGEPYRSAILLRYIEGLPPREIARRLDVPTETVKSRLKRGLQRLREALDAAHGGSRRAWMAVLLPVAGLAPWTSASAWSTGGRVMSQGAGMKTAAVAVAVLLLGGAVLLHGGVFGGGDGEDGAEPRPLTTGPGDPRLATTEKPAAPPLEAADRSRKPPAEDPAAVAAPGGTTKDPETAAVPAPAAGTTAGDEARPAVRRSPYGLPKRRPGTRIVPGGGGGMGGPTGHWTRFGPFPKPKGTARIAVTVEDEDGRRLAGADVYLGPPDTAGVEGISFGDLRKLGRTDAAGVLEAEALPDGAAAVFGNFNNRLNGRFGLDGRHGVKTTMQPGRRATATVRLPISTAKLGAVAGRVVGPAGQPVPSSVAIGFAQMWTKKDGAFVLNGIAEGQAVLYARATGFTPRTLDVEVGAGRTTNVVVKLEYADAGTMRIEGIVVGPQDEPVAGANVYLMMKEERGTLRRAVTDAQGRFSMERLPERVRTEASRLQGSRVPHYASHVLHFETGIHDERVRLRLPLRYVQLELRILDAETGEPIRQLNVTAERPESKRPRANITYDYDQGYRRGMVEPGRHTIRIDALDHEDVELELDVTLEGGETFSHEVRLKRVSPQSVEVALTLRLTDAVTGEPIARARVEVLESGTGQPLSRLEGRRVDGEYRLPAPSGGRRLRVTAEGYEAHEAPLDLKPDEPEVERKIQLRPR